MERLQHTNLRESKTLLATPVRPSVARGRGWGPTVTLPGVEGVFLVGSLWDFTTAAAAGAVCGGGAPRATLGGRAGSGGPRLQDDWGTGWLSGLMAKLSGLGKDCGC